MTGVYGASPGIYSGVRLHTDIGGGGTYQRNDHHDQEVEIGHAAKLLEEVLREEGQDGIF